MCCYWPWWPWLFRVLESHWFTWVSQSNHIPMNVAQDDPCGRAWLIYQVFLLTFRFCMKETVCVRARACVCKVRDIAVSQQLDYCYSSIVTLPCTHPRSFWWTVMATCVSVYCERILWPCAVSVCCERVLWACTASVYWHILYLLLCCSSTNLL